MQEIKNKIDGLVERGTTLSLIANLAGVHKSELGTIRNGGRLTPAKEKLVVRFVDSFTECLKMADAEWPGLQLDLRDGNFVRKLVEAADIVRRERQAEVEQATAGIAECRRQIEEASPVR